MRCFRVILGAITFLASIIVNAQSERAIIVNGHFFNELPAEAKIAQGAKIHMISTPDGSNAIGFEIPGTLSQEALQYEVPAADITEGEELLRRYKEAVSISKGKSISFGAGDAPLINIGDTFPKFSAVDIDGRTWTNSDVEGKVMVLNLWFTGCGPCRSEMPELSEWKNEMPDVMFFSSTYEAPEIARKVLDKGIFNWIPLVNDTQFTDYIGVHGYPLTIVIGKDGKIAAFEYGTSPEQRARLKSTISSLR